VAFLVAFHASEIAESAVNALVSRRFVKKQQMRWSPLGAQHLLNIRTQVVNGEYTPALRKSAAKAPLYSFTA
jgi:hypothetical protein